MKKKEKFTKEIVDITVDGSNIAVNKQGVPVPCAGFICADCSLYGFNASCRQKFKEWAESEYVEPKRFTEEEKAILKALPKANWIARDNDMEVYLFTDKPTKRKSGWFTNGHFCRITDYVDANFESVRCEDTEPVSREEVLG